MPVEFSSLEPFENLSSFGCETFKDGFVAWVKSEPSRPPSSMLSERSKVTGRRGHGAAMSFDADSKLRSEYTGGGFFGSESFLKSQGETESPLGAPTWPM